jgi:hypothetical protein
VYRIGKVYRVVVEEAPQSETASLHGVEEQTARAIVARVRTPYQSRAKPWADPTAERVMEFEVDVIPAAGGSYASPLTVSVGSSHAAKPISRQSR